MASNNNQFLRRRLVKLGGICGWACRLEIEKTNDEDAERESRGVQALSEIRAMFTEGVDELASWDVVQRLVANADGPWVEYRRGKPLTQRQLARLLAAYGIHPITVHPPNQRHANGYTREQFAEAWQRYLPAAKPAENPSPAENPDSGPCDRANSTESRTSASFSIRAQ